ncbi:MAG: SAM-dependent methyltransferase [Cyanobacteria bacterium P01_F01_bin.33]
MFGLTPTDLRSSIIDCGGSPASFNAELTRCKGRVVSCDPLYSLSAVDMCDQIETTYDTILNQTLQYRDRYVWDAIPTPEDLGRVRMAAMSQFLDDYEIGRQASRYRVGQLPRLPFAAGQFDLALCSHFLFTYSDRLTRSFRVESILEMGRVAREVRIFPLVDLSGQPSQWLKPVREDLERAGWWSELETARYKFQRGGNRCLRVRRHQPE